MKKYRYALNLIDLVGSLSRLDRRTQELVVQLTRRGAILAKWAPADHPRAGEKPNGGWFIHANAVGDSVSTPSKRRPVDPSEAPYVAEDYQRFKTTVGDGNCVPLVQAAAGVPNHRLWKEGLSMSDRPDIPEGTAIATFVDGTYPSNSHGNHAAIFIGYGTESGKDGFYVYDQYHGQNGTQKKPGRRFIRFVDPGHSASDNGNAFSIIK